MDSSYISLSSLQVATAGLLILASGILGIALKLNITKPLYIAGLRTTFQLFGMGLVLQWVFKSQSIIAVILMMSAMTLVAAWTATERSIRPFPGILVNSIAAIWLSSWSLLIFASTLVFKIRSWSDPQYVIPLLGMILGNSLNGICLAMDKIGRAHV